MWCQEYLIGLLCNFLQDHTLWWETFIVGLLHTVVQWSQFTCLSCGVVRWYKALLLGEMYGFYTESFVCVNTCNGPNINLHPAPASLKGRSMNIIQNLYKRGLNLFESYFTTWSTSLSDFENTTTGTAVQIEILISYWLTEHPDYGECVLLLFNRARGKRCWLLFKQRGPW